MSKKIKQRNKLPWILFCLCVSYWLTNTPLKADPMTCPDPRASSIKDSDLSISITLVNYLSPGPNIEDVDSYFYPGFLSELALPKTSNYSVYTRVKWRGKNELFGCPALGYLPAVFIRRIQEKEPDLYKTDLPLGGYRSKREALNEEFCLVLLKQKDANASPIPQALLSGWDKIEPVVDEAGCANASYQLSPGTKEARAEYEGLACGMKCINCSQENPHPVVFGRHLNYSYFGVSSDDQNENVVYNNYYKFGPNRYVPED